MSGKSKDSQLQQVLGQQNTKWSELRGDEKREIQREVLDAIIAGDNDKCKAIIEQYEGLRLDYCVYENDHGDNPLHLAAYHGHLQIVKYLIEEGHCQSECRNGYRNTPLHRAARQGKFDIVQYLIEEQHCDPMCVCHWGRTPLHIACRHSQLEVVKYLMNLENVDFNAKVKKHGSTPLDLAAGYGTVDVVKYMIEEKNCYNPDKYINSNTPLHFAAYRGNLPVVQYLVGSRGFDVNVKGSRNRTPLHSACRGGRLEVVKFLMETNKVEDSCHDHEHGITPLDLAAEHGTLALVQYMVDERNVQLQFSSQNRYTPLHHAACGGKLEIVDYFIKTKGYKPDCKGLKGRTPLHSACRGAKNDMVKHLIREYGVDPSCRDDDGNAPLHSAVKSGHRSVVALLIIEFDCNPKIINNDWRDPEYYAEKLDHRKLTKALERAKNFRHNKLRTDLEERLTITKAIPTGRKVIARGIFSSIIELKISESGERVAGKVFKKDPSDTEELNVEKIIKMITTITSLHHVNIVESKGVCFLPDRILPVLLMERMMNSLQSYFKRNTGYYTSSLPGKRRITMLRDIASGLKYLHGLNPPFIHGHLTVENVLLNAELRVKIGGFNIDCYSQVPQSHEYTPPEVQGGAAQPHPSHDVFSFGHLCLVTMLQRELDELPPAQYSDNEGKLCIRYEDERRAKFIQEAKNMFPENFNVIEQCLQNNPAKRPKMGYIILKLQGASDLMSDNDVEASSGKNQIRDTKSYDDVIQGKMNVVQDEAALQDKMDIFSDDTVIRGADITAQTKIEITPDQPLDYHWEGHGFKVHIPAGAISEKRGPVTLCIQASLSGDYQLPDDGVLVSGVYWLSLHPPVKRFSKKVTLSLQHCASDGDSTLSFVTAQCTQPELPYAFKKLSEGTFDSRVGNIEVESFSGYAASSSEVYDYAFHTYYIPRQLNIYNVHIAVTPDLELQLVGVQNKYAGKEEGPSAIMCIKEEKISLNIRQPDVGVPDEAWETDGWELTPLLQPPTLHRRILDCYKKGKSVPHFELNLKLTEKTNPKTLKQKIGFTGVQESLIILREPIQEGPLPPISGVKEQRTRQPLGIDDLFDVKSELEPVTVRWRHIGLALRLNPDKLDEIERDNRDSGDCFIKTLTLWLQKNYNTEKFGEPSWELLARAVAHPAGGNNFVLAEKLQNR